MKLYIVTVVGEYYANAGDKKEILFFEEDFNITDSSMALSIIQNKLINFRLKDKDKNSLGFRTCRITSIKEEKKKTYDKSHNDIDNMCFFELAEFCLFFDLDVPLSGSERIARIDVKSAYLKKYGDAVKKVRVKKKDQEINL